MEFTSGSTGEKRKDKAVLTAAYLKYLSQTEEEIANTLRVAQPTVSRYVTDARKRGWLQLSLNEKNIPAQLLAVVKEEAHGAKELQEKVRKWAGTDVSVRAFFSGKEDLDSKEGYGHRLARFAKGAAPSIVELLRTMGKTGVAWGRTLRAVVDALREEHESGVRWVNEGVQFMPVVGEPLNYPTADCGASRLVADLHRWAACKGDPHSMDSVAACIPHKHANNIQTILSYYCHVRTYAKMFGEPNQRSQPTPLIEQLNCVLTSVGTKHLSDDWIVDAAEAANKSVEQLDEITYGNISGVFLPRPRINATQRKTINEINKRGTGIKLKHLQHCATMKPGVVVLAIGRGKGHIIRACLIEKTISQLYIDQDLKDELLRLD